SRVLGPEVGAVQLELHAGDAHVVARVGGDRDRGRNGGPTSGRRDGDRRRCRVVRDRDGDGGRRRLFGGGVTGLGVERVAPAGRGLVPSATVFRSSRVLGPEVGAVQLELHAGDAHVVARVGGDRDRGRNGGPARRRRDRYRRRCRIVRHG